MLALGIHLRAGAAHAVLVNVHTGQVVSRSTQPTPTAACRAVIGSPGMFSESIVGIGLAPAARAEPNFPHSMAELGVPADVAIAIARSDLHACVPGVGVASPSTMVMILGEDTHLLMNSRVQRDVPGVAAPEPDAILPGYFAYVAMQPRTGGSAGDRASIESSAYDLRRLVETMQSAGVPVRRFVATGLHSQNALLVQIYADVLNERIAVSACDEPAAIGAAILGCLAAGPAVTGYAHASLAIHAIARPESANLYRPDLASRRRYEALYADYRRSRSG